MRAQSEFLWLVRFEYGLLLLAAVISMEALSNSRLLFAYATIFIFALAAMLLRTLRSADRDWYQCRALAESVKTLTWRYSMRAEPFDGAQLQQARADFRNLLAALLRANRHIGRRIAGLNAQGEQITPEMDAARTKSLAERKEQYLAFRICDQRDWYNRNASANKQGMTRWITICAFVYVAAILSILSKLENPEWNLPYRAADSRGGICHRLDAN